MRSFVLFGILFLVVPECLAHGGGLNKDGCHNDRKNGGYHCHRSPVAAPIASPRTPAGGAASGASTSRPGTSGNAPTEAARVEAAAAAGGQAWLGDNVARIYFKASCEASRLIPAARLVRITNEATLKSMGYTRSTEPGC